MSKPSAPKFTRAMLILFPLAKAFALRGGDVEAVLARNRIPLGALSDPSMLVEASACYAALEDMAETLGDPYFGATVAIETARKGTPGLREAASRALTLGDFLSRVVVEVSKQVDNVRYSVFVSPDVASLEIQRTINVSKPSRQLDAVGVAFYVTVIRQGIGDTFDPNDILVTVPTTVGLPPGVSAETGAYHIRDQRLADFVSAAMALGAIFAGLGPGGSVTRGIRAGWGQRQRSNPFLFSQCACG